MRVTQQSDPRAFAGLARPLLLRDEARHCMVLGILDTLVSQPERYPSSQLLAMEGEAGLQGVAWRTPPHPLGLSAMPRAAIHALVDYLAATSIGVSALAAARPEVDVFLERWLERRGGSTSHCIDQRIYRLEKLLVQARAPGALRTATALDLDLVLPWSMAFVRECGLGGGDEEELRHGVSVALEHGQRVLWEREGTAVAMAGFGGKTPSGVRISWVYTPPALRGRGYASALVAALSDRLLAEGHRRCFLYTDLANPTSNGIYRRIGYEPVCDAAHYTFSA
jgi:GNAT superfamily N-acetyltransferase